jgi:hypothetical protein
MVSPEATSDGGIQHISVTLTMGRAWLDGHGGRAWRNSLQTCDRGCCSVLNQQKHSVWLLQGLSFLSMAANLLIPAHLLKHAATCMIMTQTNQGAAGVQYFCAQT